MSSRHQVWSVESSLGHEARRMSPRTGMIGGVGQMGYCSAAYASKLLQNLNNLRIGEWFCDVEIVADGVSFMVHRAVLAASSSYFNAMFTGGMVENQRRSIHIQGVAPSTMKALISFIYTGEANVSHENVQALMLAADMLQITEVVVACSDFFKKELHTSNALGIYIFADGHNFQELAHVALSYVYRHFVDVASEEEFLDTPADVLIKLLNSEYLKVENEYQVLCAALRWCFHETDERIVQVCDVLQSVRLPIIPSHMLNKAIASCQDTRLQDALRLIQDHFSKSGKILSLPSTSRNENPGEQLCALVPSSSFNPRIGAKKNIYIVGGGKRELISTWTKSSECTFASVQCYDTFRNEWRMVSQMDIARILPGVAVLEGQVYVVGGELDSLIMANGELYDPHEDTWRAVASMEIPRCEFGLCALDGYLYAFGGWVGEDIGGSIERYDPNLDSWMLIDDMSESRFSMGVVAYCGLIYIVGGCTHSRRHMQELVSYNPTFKEWSTLAPMKVPRSQMGVAVLDGHLYVVGGTGKQNEILSSVERYCFEDDRWTEITPMSVGRASPAVASADGKLYVIGGNIMHEVNFFRAHITVTKVEYYDPTSGLWHECEPLPESRSEAGAAVV